MPVHPSGSGIVPGPAKAAGRASMLCFNYDAYIVLRVSRKKESKVSGRGRRPRSSVRPGVGLLLPNSATRGRSASTAVSSRSATVYT